MSGRFVVQRHRARALHFDLRLEVDQPDVGPVAVSWAVPKGPSMDPAVLRLAVRVGDHELADLDREGPAGEGHRGSTVVWDTGTYDDLTPGSPSTAAALADGHLRFVLHGQRLAGRFSLRRTAMAGNEANWLLRKYADDEAQPGSDVAALTTSVLTGISNEEYEAEV